MDTDLARAWITAIAASVVNEKQRLTDLDTAIGDGDHGNNLERGFTAAVTALAGDDAACPGDILVRTGRTLISRVGGAAGPLYGVAFRTAGERLTEPEAGLGELAEALTAGADAVRTLGGARPGDKTMLDAFMPAVDALDAGAAEGSGLAAAVDTAAAAAEEGARSTVPMQARKGRASYLGERSIGHEDPGAASTAVIFRALARVVS
ncbi:dihydroxyacetone kinase subunit DhaL [Nocardiopsis mangrovi]|uniref:Dihydroxyacetone kinase subunit DhaL n=1 Tax=Nocardiopsis mangrovi TaxID=1179818 RepID=A0ABV9DR47_9ACTN